MADVFVSYSREDQGTAQSITDALEWAGLSVFRELFGAVGSSFGGSMHEQIDSARCIVCLWSQAAAGSSWLQQEINQAIRAWSEGRLVLATLDDTPLPVGLRDLQGVPIGKDQGGIDATRLLAEVKSIIGRSSETEALVGSALPQALLPRRRGVAILAVALSVFVGAGAALLWINTASEPPTRKARGGGMGMGKSATPAPDITRPSPLPAPQTTEIPPPAGLPPGSGTSDDRPKSPPPPTYGTPGGVPAPMPEVAPAPLPLPTGTPERAPADGLIWFALMLALGAAIGAGSMWVLSLRSSRQRRREAGDTAVQSAFAAPAAPPTTDPTHQVFVSYSRQDGPAVDDLVKEIEQAGYAVWIDRHSTGSQRYAAPIVRAIKTSRIVALMCSQNAFTSDHVIREVYVAGDYKKPFIAFQLDHSDFPDDVQYFVSGFPRVQTDALDIQQLRSELARLVAA